MCRTLQAVGVEVLLATTDADMDVGLKPRLGRITTYKDVPLIVFEKQWGASFKYSRSFARWLIDNVSRYDVVHIHAVFNHACLAAARACRKRNIPYIVRPLGTLVPWSMNQKPIRKSLFWHVVGRRMLSNAATVHYTALAEQQATETSLCLNHGTVMPLGVDTDSLNVKDTQSSVSEIPRLAGHPYVLILSRLHPKKGLDIFLQAFLSVVDRPEFAAWRLVLAGDGPTEYVELLREKISSHKAKESVLFSGWLEGDLKINVLRHAALLALPSHHENFGLCVMEALACGVPVLVSPHVNLAAAVSQAGAGWIVPVQKEPIELALIDAFSRSAERDKRGKSGRDLSLQFSWKHIGEGLLKMYSSVSNGVRSM